MTRAADVMTEDPVTIQENSTVGEAVRVLDQLAIRHLPVVDDDGNLVGMLSDRDLRGEPGAADDEALPAAPPASARVIDVMSSNVVEANADDDITELATLMVDNNVGAVPIVDGSGALVGIVSYVDILRSIASGGEPDVAADPLQIDHEERYVEEHRTGDSGGAPIGHVVPARPKHRPH